MPLLKKCLRAAKGVATFGGSIKVEDAQAHYDRAYEQYKPLLNEVTQLTNETQQALKAIGLKLEQVKDVIEQVQHVLNAAYFINASQFANAGTAVTSIEHFKSSYDTARNAGVGGVVGGTSAVGAWALVTSLGSASTGTSIAGLSGVAASNATLAWFGGGSLAAGGAGMAGGMMMIGGIVVTPILYFAAKGSYKKARKIESETIKVVEERAKLLDILPTAKQELHLAKQCAAHINVACNDYIALAEQLLAEIINYDSQQFKWYRIKTWFSRKPDANVRKNLLEILAKETNVFLLLLQRAPNPNI